MADEATNSEQLSEQETSTSKVGARRRTRVAQAQENTVGQEVTSAVAASLAELEKEKPQRITRRKKVDVDAVEALEESIPASSTPQKKTRRTRSGSTRATAVLMGEQDSQPSTPEKPAFSPGAVFFTAAETDASPVASVENIVLPPSTAVLFQEPDVARARTRVRTLVKPVHLPLDTQEDADDAAPAQEETEQPTRRRATRTRRKGQESKQQAEASVQRDSREEREDDERFEPEVNAESKEESEGDTSSTETLESGVRRRRRRRSNVIDVSDEVAAPKGSTRLEAKRQRRKEGREAGRRRHTITEAEYLARRESVKREMLVREKDGLNQIAVLEDDVLVEHYVARHTQVSMVGNVYLGRVQNVLPSMEAAFVDIGKGRNAVLYAGEVNWEAAGLEGKPRRIEQALKSGDTVLVQVTKDPIGHKGARLTAQITLAGRHLVLVPSGAMTGISRKLPEKERQRLKKLLRQIVPEEHGVIVRTAAEGASEEQLRADVERLTKAWADIQEKAKNFKAAPTLLKGEPELAVRVVRDIFNEDFQTLRVQGDEAWSTISSYVGELSPELSSRLSHWTSNKDIFAEHRVDEQLAKAFDRKVWLPSGGTLVIDRTEAMTVIDVNTGKFTGAGGTLEETVTRNNLEAAEEIVRQLRLRDIGGIIVVDFIDMVLESNRELVLRRLVECLGRDPTRHQVAEVTSLGLVQMTRKRVGQGLVEAFSTACEHCEGRGFITHTHPVEKPEGGDQRRKQKQSFDAGAAEEDEAKREGVKTALANIAAASAKEHEAKEGSEGSSDASKAAKAEKKGRSRVRTRKGKTGAGEKVPSADEATTRESSRESGSREGEGVNASDAQGQVSQTSQPSRLEANEVTTGESAGAVASKPRSSSVSRRSRAVSSSGTITPGGNFTGILSFPAQPES